jgi:hypothetical protein
MGHLNSFKASGEGVTAPLSRIQSPVIPLFATLLFFFPYFTSEKKEQGEKKWRFIVR